MAFTIHGIDENVEKALAERARREGTSRNKLVKRLLAGALGLDDAQETHDEYRDFLGLWSQEEAEAFMARQRENESIDPGDWK